MVTRCRTRAAHWRGALLIQKVMIQFRDPMSESEAGAKLRESVTAWPPFDLSIDASDNLISDADIKFRMAGYETYFETFLKRSFDFALITQSQTHKQRTSA